MKKPKLNPLHIQEYEAQEALNEEEEEKENAQDHSVRIIYNRIVTNSNYLTKHPLFIAIHV